MSEKDFQDKLGELIKQIGELPSDQREPLEALASETQTRHDRVRKTISELQESLDYLRLSLKYLVFDLEATRRENRYLRNLLEQGNNKPERE